MPTPKNTKSVTSHTRKAPKLSPAQLFAQRPIIKSLIEKVVAESDDRYDDLIVAAEHLGEIRAAFEAERESFGLTWYEWARVHMGLKDRNRLALLGRVADAKTRKDREVLISNFRRDDARRHSELRARNREPKKKDRRTAKVRKHLIAWAQTAQRSDVTKAWIHVRKVFLS